MFSSRFSESKQSSSRIEDTSKAAFAAFLEFLYWDHCPIQECEDSVGILVLANRFNLSRLISLCELYITKQVEVATTDDITKAKIDVIGLLLCSQTHNAKQLEAFCKHFISSNYQPMRKRQEWNLLKGENLKFIEQNQWPPLSYLNELETYEKATGNKGGAGGDDKCSLM